MVAADEELLARLRRLEDLEAIRQLFVDYGHHLDRGDLDAYAELFAEDGELLLGPMGRARGRAEIRELMGRATAASAGRSWHLITNPIIELDGDRARSEVMWSVVVRGEDEKAVLSMLGRHRDVLVRRDGRWQFQRREGHIDVPSRYPGGAARAGAGD
ncbi:MAG TPA: nuclear transport factor 2 family protein [Acidimicrobiales bacterium]|nr:nuclear transport factor 2 family protein [Acidimicrobiales bacterium]